MRQKHRLINTVNWTFLLKTNGCLVQGFMKLDLEVFRKTVAEEEVMFLATSKDDDVTIRPVSPLIMEGMTVYFYTGNQSEKYAQMRANPKVAFSLGLNGCYQVQGTVKFLGGVFEEKNTQIRNAYKEKYKGAFEVAAPGEDFSTIEFMAVDIKVLKGWIFDVKDPNVPLGMGVEIF